MESLTSVKTLYNASISGDIEALNKLLEEDAASVLDDYASFAAICPSGTPLHVAVTQRHLAFAQLLLQRKPELVNKVDFRLRTPLHLASANGLVDMVKLLLDANSDCLMMDEFGRTPLHLAVMMNGGVEVVAVLVQKEPEAIMQLLSSVITVAILHSYVLRYGLIALEGLVKVNTFLNSQDGQGNTILHRLIALKKHEMLEYLISGEIDQLIDVKLVNQNNLTTLDLMDQMTQDPKTILLRKRLYEYTSVSTRTRPIDAKSETLFDKKRNAIMVVATVIAGMAYQAALNPPGGVWDDDHIEDHTRVFRKNETISAGRSILASNDPELYILFCTFNTISYTASLLIVLLLIHDSPLRYSGTSRFRVFLSKLYMYFLTCVLWVTATATTLSYLYGVAGTTPDSLFHKTEFVIGSAQIFWLVFIGIGCLINATRGFTFVTKKLLKFINKKPSSYRMENVSSRYIATTLLV